MRVNLTRYFFKLSGTIKNNKIGYLKGISNRYNIR